MLGKQHVCRMNELARQPILAGVVPEHTPACKQHKSMWIVHVSGIPGSGKSYLGTFLEQHLGGKGIAVVDTDSLIQHNTPIGDYLLELEQEADGTDGQKYNTAWGEIFTSEISKIIEEHTTAGQTRVLVLVGILDHFGHGADPVEIREPFMGFYMDVPDDLLLYRYYSRTGTVPFDTEDNFWQHVAGLALPRWSIPGSIDYLNDASKTKEWHKKKGYEVLSAKQIIERVAQLAHVPLASFDTGCSTHMEYSS